MMYELEFSAFNTLCYVASFFELRKSPSETLKSQQMIADIYGMIILCDTKSKIKEKLPSLDTRTHYYWRTP